MGMAEFSERQGIIDKRFRLERLNFNPSLIRVVLFAALFPTAGVVADQGDLKKPQAHCGASARSACHVDELAEATNFLDRTIIRYHALTRARLAL